MALEHQIGIAREHFGIRTPEDWCGVRPEWITQLHGCGPATVDHLRIYLAARGLTLRDDGTPAYWQQHLASARIGGQLSDTDDAIVLPFTVLIDTAEKKPYIFQGVRGDAKEKRRTLIVPIEYRSLGPTHGDYSIDGYERMCHVERKSMADAQGTFLSHGERRDRWQNTLAFLAEIPTAAVVIECTFGQMIANVESRGRRSKGILAKTLHRQVLAWQEDYRIPFYFCDDRRFAEVTTLAILRRFYRKQMEEQLAEKHSTDAVIGDL